jgi:hypothetical protein
MSRYIICEIDKEVNKDKQVQLDKALKNVAKYITKTIDETFPEDKFQEWLDSGEDAPFEWNHNKYYWERKK